MKIIIIDSAAEAAYEFIQMLKKSATSTTSAVNQASKTANFFTAYEHNAEEVYVEIDSGLRKVGKVIKRVSVPVNEGFRLISPSMVVHCEADANFTWIYLENGDKLITCRLLREMEGKFSSSDFLKVHRSHLVNIDKVEAMLRNDGWELVLCNGRHVPVARERKDAVMKALGVSS